MMMDKIKLSQAFREAADMLLGTLWIQKGVLPTMTIVEQLRHNNLMLEVKNPASEKEVDREIVMFTFLLNGFVELTIYYDLRKAASKKAVELHDSNARGVTSYQEAIGMLLAYYAEVMF